ncbi:MAG: metallophosphoesterase [Eubacteriales bacterium]|nr:metallophosphoesterase [Eubacteriales bacterium]
MITKSIYDRPATVKHLELPEGKRILVISDIHGNMEYFRGVLDRVHFSEDDILIINGDFCEKGPDSLGVLRYIMELSGRGNVHTICGNCDDWGTVFTASPEADGHILQYILHKKRGLLWDMLRECGIDPFAVETLAECKKQLFNGFLDEWRFLMRLPHAIETDRFIFAHAACDPSKPLNEQSVDDFVKYDYFLNSNRFFDKWVIVGHMPVVLYHKNIVCANPIVDKVKKIVSIDGGCVLKDDGQLNCLMIPHKDSQHFYWSSYDSFPEYTALDAQSEGERSYYVAWSDSRVQVLERGEEFSRCRHVTTGYELDILTKYLFSDEEITRCNDCTDYVIPIEKGDVVKVVETTSRGYFIKHKGVSGWYFGRLEKI